MKKTVIGGFLVLTGTAWAVPMLVYMLNNLVASWAWNSRLFLTVVESGLILPFALSVLASVVGLLILGIEYFRKQS